VEDEQINHLLVNANPFTDERLSAFDSAGRELLAEILALPVPRREAACDSGKDGEGERFAEDDRSDHRAL
jgi:hypothetical protein